MVPYYHINNDFYKAKNIDIDLDWVIIYYFCKPINNNKD